MRPGSCCKRGPPRALRRLTGIETLSGPMGGLETSQTARVEKWCSPPTRDPVRMMIIIIVTWYCTNRLRDITFYNPQNNLPIRKNYFHFIDERQTFVRVSQLINQALCSYNSNQLTRLQSTWFQHQAYNGVEGLVLWKINKVWFGLVWSARPHISLYPMILTLPAFKQPIEHSLFIGSGKKRSRRMQAK